MNYPKRKESDLQKSVVEWIYKQYPNILMTIAPNIKKSMAQGVMLKRMGYRAGTPDIMIFEPLKLKSELLESFHCIHGLFLELKMPRNIGTDKQKEFKLLAEKRGYRYEICPKFKTEKECFDWAINEIKEYMAGIKGLGLE